jgi:hypothetical protein
MFLFPVFVKLLFAEGGAAYFGADAEGVGTPPPWTEQGID